MQRSQESKIRFGHAARAAGLTEANLRTLLHRHKDIDLSGARPENGWREFTEPDLFVLALAVELIKHGCPVRDAIRESRTALGVVDFKTWKGLPTDLFAAETEHGWVVANDEGLLWAVGGRGPLASVVKINLPTLVALVQLRLIESDLAEVKLAAAALPEVKRVAAKLAVGKVAARPDGGSE